jgi:hypothetical protein
MINTSSKTLEVQEKIHKIKQSPRHEDGTTPGVKIVKRQVKKGF